MSTSVTRGQVKAGTALTKTGNTLAVSLGYSATQAAKGSDLEALLLTYAPIRDRGGLMSALAASVQLLYPDGTNASGGSTTGRTKFYLDPARFAITGRTTKFRLFADLGGNNTNPGASVNFTAGLYPVTIGGGAAGAVVATAGVVVTGSTANFNPNAANADLHADSGDFTPPAAGSYALGCAIDVNMAANSAVVVRTILAVTHV
jgi:hypothetical protein